MARASAGTPHSLPFDLMPTAMAVVDSAGRVLAWSDAAVRMLGHQASDMVGRNVAGLLVLPPDPAGLAAAGIGGPPAGGEARPGGVVVVRHRDGHTLTLGVQASALTDAAGRQQWTLAAIDLGREPWWGQSYSALSNFLTQSPYGIAVLDTALRYLWLNEELERMAGVPLGDRLGRTMSEVLPGIAPQRVEEQMRRVLESGTPVLNFTYHGYVPAHPGSERTFSSTIMRLADSTGHVLGICYMTLDVTERYRSRERLNLLTESGARIGTTLDIGTTAQELAKVAVPRLAEYCALDLFAPVLTGEEPRQPGSGGWPPLLRMGSLSARDGSPGAGVDDVLDYALSASMPRVLAAGEALLSSDVETDQLAEFARSCAPQVQLAGGPAESLMAVPVLARGTILGLALFLRSGASEPFAVEDLLLAEQLVARTGICLDNARRYAREHSTALTLQRSLLPHVLPASPTLDIAYRYLPSDAWGGVGGDWFDVIPLSGCRVALVVGDVVGHGINAAAAMGRLRTAVHTLADMDLAPDELLAHLDDVVLRLIDDESASTAEHAAAAAQGATCLYAVYDPVTRRCAMARAGHVPPAIVAPDGSVAIADLPPGPPLGIGALPFESAEIALPEGSLLALYTDGLLLGSRDLDDPAEHLRRALEGPPSSLEAVCDRALATVPTDVQRDDIVLLLARTKGLDPDQVAAWDLAHDPAIVAEARAKAARTLHRWELDQLVDTTELLVSELVTNAIRYGTGPIRLRLIRQSALICEVSDGSSTSPRLRHARTTDEGGRGLFLVAQLTRRWGTRYSTPGKVIWAEQSLTPRLPSGDLFG